MPRLWRKAARTGNSFCLYDLLPLILPRHLTLPIFGRVRTQTQPLDVVNCYTYILHSKIKKQLSCLAGQVLNQNTLTMVCAAATWTLVRHYKQV